MGPNSILLVSNYYPPERGAAPNRMYVLAEALCKEGYDVHVLCPLPNYPTGKVYSGFKGKRYHKSYENKCTVYRLWLWPSKSKDTLVRLFSMLSFSLSLSHFFLLKRIPKRVLVQYSPVFVGFTAVFWSWLFRKKIILNVSDLWPLAGLEMGLLKKGMHYSILEGMERFCYQKAGLILGQSNEILHHISIRKKGARLLLYRNYPNFETPNLMESIIQPPITIVYAGLLGVAQGLSTILGSVEIPNHVEFHIYGDGPDLDPLERLRHPRIVFHGTISRDVLHKELQQYDMAFIPLAQRIYGSVPSKIFEYARLGLPLLYMGGGEGEELVKKHQLGWALPVSKLESFTKFLTHLHVDELKNFPKETIQERARRAFDFDAQFKLLLQHIEDF